MPVDEAVQWAQIVGAVAVVASLGYLAAQIRQNTNAIRASTGEAISASFDELVRTALLSEENLAVFDRAVFPEAAGEDLERRRARWAAFLVLNAIERSFLAEENGTLERDVTAPITKGMLEKVLRGKMVVEALRSGYYDSRFRAYAEQVLKSASVRE